MPALRKAVSIALVICLAAQPALAQGSGGTGGGAGSLWNLLAQLQQMFSQLRQWVDGQFSSALDAVRSRIAPITDTYHATRSIARWLESLASGLPDMLRGLLSGAADRFRNAAAPPPGTISGLVRQIIDDNPDSALSRKVRAHEELSAATDASVGRARAAQRSAEEAARNAFEDSSPVVNTEVASQAARELAARASEVPSTRAAVQLLIEGFAAFMDQQARQNADLSNRITALVQQQAELSHQLTSVVEQAASMVELLNQQQKQQAEAAAAGMHAAVNNSMTGLRSLVGVMSAAADRSGESELYDSLSRFYRSR